MTKQELEKEGYKSIILDNMDSCYFINEKGDIISIRNGFRLLKHQINNKGYYCVRLSFNNKRKGFLVHRLIAISFIPNPNNYLVINHINGVATDNSLNNLEWCTQSYNRKHSFIIGKSFITEEQKRRIGYINKGKTGALCLFSKKVIDISNNKIYNSQSEAAKALGLKRSTLCAILIGQNKNRTNIRYYEEN